MDMSELKELAKFIWAQGDYPEVATRIASAADALVDACGIGAGTTVLDVAAGNGNVAVAAAKRGARVIASDITPELVAAGRERSEREGLDIEWREADAEELPFEDDQFDVVTSCFGAIFAPRAERTAGELVRVAKPGGKVGFTAWSMEGFQGQVFKVAAQYMPPQPEGVDSPLSWGVEATARERFGKYASAVEVQTGTVHWEFDSVDEWEEWSETKVPPIVVAKQMLPDEVFKKMREESVAVAQRFNQAEDGSMRLESEYLLIVATK